MTKFSKILLRAVGELPPKQNVFATILKEINSPLTGLKQVRNGYLAFMEREEELDKLLSTKAQTELKKIGLETKVPPQIKCQRSLICRQIDSYVGEHTAQELMNEINQQNRNKAIEIIKFKQYTHIFKIEFQTTEMAMSAKRNGLLCFNTRITPNQMEQEKHTDVLMCFTCYKIESHIKANCPTPHKVVCSECSGEHFHTECTSEYKKCVNCNGNHRTMAMSCPMKKEAIKRKREEEERRKKEKEDLPLSKIVERTANEIGKKTEERVMSSVLGEAGLRALIMVMDAHVHNIIEPGSYNNRLNQTLVENNIEPIKLPNNKLKSEKLMQANHITEKLKEQLDAQKTETSPKRKKSRGQDMEEEIRRRDEERENEWREEEMEMEDIPELEDITEDEAILDMHLHREDTPADASLYKIKMISQKPNLTDQTPEQIKELYQQNKIKFNRTTETKISNRTIEELILAKKMGCKSSNIVHVTKAKYREFKNGQITQPQCPTK